MAKVILKNVTKEFGKVVAVNDLSLEVEDGEFFVLLGPSGAGKTTTLKLIAGVERPTEGLVFIGDRVVNALEPQDRNVAMAFESYALYPYYTVYENLAFPLRAPGMSLANQEIDEQVKRVAKMLGIDMLLDRRPDELSGGQKQRASLGRTLVREPDVFLLDEPISHLDAKLRHRMRAEFQRLEESIPTTTIYVTHDYLEALSLSDRIAVINEGQLQQIGTSNEVFNRPRNVLVATLLGQPEINLVECEVSSVNGQIQLRGAGGAFTVSPPPELQQAIEKRNLQQVLAGIRPMHVSLVNGQTIEPRHDRIRGQVYVFEPLGTKGALNVLLGDVHFVVLAPIDTDVDIDQNVELAIESDEIMVFDPRTKENLLASGN